LTIVTPYVLPFPAKVSPPPLFSGGASVTLAVTAASSLTEDALMQLDGFVSAFSMLADSGALGGDRIPPWASHLDDTSEPISTGFVATWKLSGCHLDERSAVILVHLLLGAHEEVPLRSILLGSSTSSLAPLPLASDPDLENPYPPRWPTVPFELDEEEFLSDSRQVWIRFRKTPTAAEAEAIDDALTSWAIGAASGAYAIAEFSPLRASLIFPETVEWVDDELAWPLSKTRLHSASMDGLINACVAIDHGIVPIAEMRID
jgi:hypothetical protein